MFKKIAILCLLTSATSVGAATSTELEALLSMPLDDSVAESQLSDSSGQSLTTGCLLSPSVDSSIASPVPGVLGSLLVGRGDLVKKGQVLFKLSSEVEQATLKLNRAQTDYGKRTIQRNIDLFERNLIAEQEKDDIIITNRIYSYEMDQTQALLQQKTVSSPLTGVVVETFLDPGEYVGEEPVLRVVQLDPLYLEAVVPAQYQGMIVAGKTAEVLLERPFNSSFQARIEIVDRVLDAASGTFGVRLSVDNPDYLLPAGLKCNVNFELEDPAKI
jgi:membrane fusion protein (multidrug efflux system)